MSPSLELSDYKARQLRGDCVKDGCPRRALPGDDYCERCGERTKARKRRWAKNKRAGLRKRKRCLDCGRRRKRGRQRCKGCLERQSGRVDPHANRVDPEDPARGRIKLEADARPGRTVASRYVGRERRGAPSKEDTDRDARSDLDDAVNEIAAVRDDGIALLRSNAVALLGAIQRRAASAEVADRLLRTARICTMVAEYLCKGRAAELLDEDK